MRDLLVVVRSRAAVAARDDRDARAAGVAEPRQGCRGPLRRGARHAPDRLRRRGSRACLAANGAITCAPSSAATGAPVLLLGHFDTVWHVGSSSDAAARGGRPAVRPGHLRHEGRHRDGHARRAGAARAAAAGVRRDRDALDDRRRDRQPDVAGAHRGRSAAEPGGARARAPLPGGAAKTSRKGCGEFELDVHGVAAHAGLEPGKGASAIHELARQIVALEQLQDPAARHHRQRRRRQRRHPRRTSPPRRPARRSTSGCRRWRTPAGSSSRCSGSQPVNARDPHRRQGRFRSAAARANGRRSCVCTRSPGRWRRRSDGHWAKARRAAAPTGISRPRSVFRR